MRRFTIFLAFVTLILGAGYFLFVGLPKNPMDVRQLHQRIQKELPAGSSLQSVQLWLSKNKIGNSYIDGKKNDLRLESFVVLNGYSEKDLGAIVVAMVRDTKRTFLTKWDTQIVFFFSKQDKTVGFVVESIGTGI